MRRIRDTLLRPLRWPGHARLLAVLVPLTLLLGYKVFIEDYGPFEGWVNYHRATAVDRRQLGYNGPPPYHAWTDGSGRGSFGFYANDFAYHGRFGYCRYDAPHWPDGEPGSPDGSPLPPLVIRNEIYSVAPGVPLAVLGAGWLAWGVLFVRHRLRLSPRGAGFEMLSVTPLDGDGG